MADPFWAGKRVLLTGDSGFKGSWLRLWLERLGAEVTGLSLPMQTSPALCTLLQPDAAQHEDPCDIRDAAAVTARVVAAKPEIVFHLAAQPLVRAAYRDPVSTYATNVQGTAHLLEALRLSPDLRAIVVITTDKVYQNNESGQPFKETDPLGGHDPYSASKAAAEMVSESYRLSFFAARNIGLATARAGNVIGGGDWAEDRLIPDAIRAWSAGTTLDVRRPNAIRPWQHVLEPLAGYLALAKALYHQPALAGAYNFGPETGSSAAVGDVLLRAKAQFGHGEMTFGDGSDGPHEAGQLLLCSSKAKELLGFAPRWTLDETIARTMAWYRGLVEGQEAKDLCVSDLEAYLAPAQPLRRTA